MRNQLVSIVILVLFLCAWASAATYYVKNDGNDSKDGLSDANAWATINKVNSSSFSPGDTILFKRGDTWRESLVISDAGSEGNPITFGAYGTANKPIINGSDLVTGWTLDGTNRWKASLSDTPNIVFVDGTRQETSPEANKEAVNKAGEWYYDSGNDLFYIYSTSDPDIAYTNPGVEAAVTTRQCCIKTNFALKNYITIENLEIKNGEDCGIHILQSDHWIVDNCTVHHCGKIESGNDDNILIEKCDSTTIKNCTIYEAGSHGIFIWQGDNNILEKNIVYNNHHSNIDVQRPDGGGSTDNNIIRYNRVYYTSDYDATSAGNCIYAGGQSGYPVTNLKIYYNIVYNNHATSTHTCIQLYNYTASAEIYNNTFYNSQLCLLINNLEGTVTIKNNIARTSSHTNGVLRILDSDNKTLDYNCWDVDSGTLVYIDDAGGSGPGYTEAEWSDYKSETGFDAHGINADPCFVDEYNSDYHLKSEGWRWDTQRKVWTWDDVTSRCIDAGNPGCPLGEEFLSVPDDPNNEWGENLRINMGSYGGTAEASMPPYDWALLADLTNDGTVNFPDFVHQAVDWKVLEDEQSGDLDRSSLVGLADLALLVEDWLKRTTWFGLPQFLSGDLDEDSDVDFIDFAIFAAAWLTQSGEPGWNLACDISTPADGSIDTLDLAVFVEYWLAGAGP